MYVRLGIFAGLALFFVGWMIFGEGGFHDSHKLAKTRDAQDAQIALLNARKERVQQYLDALESKDTFALETAARKYGLVGPHEKIYRIELEPEADK
jgi:cell division protein FtsB